VVGDIFFDVIAQKTSWRNNFFRAGTSYLDDAKLALGGSGNVAVGMSLLGLKTASIGKAGKDIFGKLYADDLKSNNVTTSIFFDQSLPTGIVIALTECEGERSFQVFRGANDKLTSEEVESSRQLIENSKYLYVCGYSLFSSCQQNAVLKAVDIAQHHKVKVVFDPGAYNLIQPRRKLFQHLLASSDLFCPNLKEAIAITNAETLDLAVERLRESTTLTALKLGEKGSILVCGKETIKTPAFRVTVADTTGAGDAFTAAIIYGLTQNLPLNLTAHLANWYAAQLITSYGARSYPSKNKILSFIKSLKNSKRFCNDFGK
jgi:ribokinase